MKQWSDKNRGCVDDAKHFIMLHNISQYPVFLLERRIKLQNVLWSWTEPTLLVLSISKCHVHIFFIQRPYPEKNLSSPQKDDGNVEDYLKLRVGLEKYLSDQDVPMLKKFKLRKHVIFIALVVSEAESMNTHIQCSYFIVLTGQVRDKPNSFGYPRGGLSGAQL